MRTILASSFISERCCRYPVLLAVDDFQALYCTSDYRDTEFNRIQGHHLSTSRLLLEYAGGLKSFVSSPAPLLSRFQTKSNSRVVRFWGLFLQHIRTISFLWNCVRLWGFYMIVRPGRMLSGPPRGSHTRMGCALSRFRPSLLQPRRQHCSKCGRTTWHYIQVHPHVPFLMCAEMIGFIPSCYRRVVLVEAY